MNVDDLSGTWHLVAWRQRYDDGRVVHPLGEEPVGVLHYDADRMSCLISRRPRAKFSAGGQWSAEATDRAEAYSGFLAYAGRFELDGDTVHHHVDVSLYPNWVGTDQVRQAQIMDGELYLTARLEPDGPQARIAELLWRRSPVVGRTLGE